MSVVLQISRIISCQQMTMAMLCKRSDTLLLRNFTSHSHLSGTATRHSGRIKITHKSCGNVGVKDGFAPGMGVSRTFSACTFAHPLFRLGSSSVASLSPLNKASSICLRTKPSFSQRIRAGSHSKRSHLDGNRQLNADALVYSFENDNFYRILSYFGLFQMALWGYMSVFAVQQLKTVPSEVQDTSGMPWWKQILYKQGQYKNSFSALCLIVGFSVLFITVTYPRRAIKKLWLLKGGDDVRITTFSWMGKTHTFRTPVEHVNCMESRTGRGNHIPLKIKDKSFFYLLDKQGEFHNTDLFDFVIGLKRNFK